jgi:hypothetical protein
MNIKSLYIIKRETGVCLYHKDFVEALFDPDLISSFIVAMTSFFDEATQSIASKARAFEGTDYKILVEFGTWTLGALSANEDSEQYRRKLRRIIQIFEEQFNLLRWVEMDLAVYTRFERYVIEEFIRDQITETSVIRPKLNWDLFVIDNDVRAFLSLLPESCTVSEAAEFLEIPLEVALNLAVEAYWEKAIVLINPVSADDIYQTTSMVSTGEVLDGVSPETTAALAELDGETPLAIAAERVKTANLRLFLDEIGLLAKREAVEKVSEAQATLVHHVSVLQEILTRISKLLGFRTTRRVFLESRDALVDNYTWLAFIDLEEGVDVDVRSSLTSAAVKNRLSPEVIADGFTTLLQFITRRVGVLTGPSPINTILDRAKGELQRRFPRTVIEVEWEHLTA